MPQRYSLPPEMEEGILLVELGLSPEQVDNMPENLLNNMLLYKAIKHISQNGGELQL